MFQMNLMNVATIFALLFCLAVSGSTKIGLLRLLSGDRPVHESPGVNWATVALLVTLLLLVTMEPEARVFLMFIDAVGMDFFLLLLACQFRANAWNLRDRIVIPIWRRLTAWVPFPMDIPTRRVVKEFPILSCCAVAGMLVSIGFLLVMFVPFVLGLAVVS